MSISELAEECGVAEATISRFCKRLGYKGYNAFKLAVANSTANRALSNPLAGEVLPEDSIPDMCQKDVYKRQGGGHVLRHRLRRGLD